jgi:hypothetical protein
MHPLNISCLAVVHIGSSLVIAIRCYNRQPVTENLIDGIGLYDISSLSLLHLCQRVAGFMFVAYLVICASILVQ